MSQSPEISDSSNSRKRKRGNESSSKKRKRTRSAQEDIYEDVDESKHLNLAFAKLDPNLLADHVAKKQRRFDPDATTLELEERRLPGNHLLSQGNTLLYVTK